MNVVCDYFLTPLSPIWFIVLAALLIIGVECFPKSSLGRIKPLIALTGILLSMASTFWIWNHWPIAFANTSQVQQGWILEFVKFYKLDTATLGYFIGLELFALLSIIFIDPYFKKGLLRGEVLILTLFIVTGMMLLVSANNLLMIFTALELLSLPTYVLVGIRRHDKQSAEAALKYFLFGSFASVLFVLAIALLYIQFTTFQIPLIAEGIQKLANPTQPTVIASIILFLVAIAFKVGIVPFHMWLPDVYQGAPTPITGFMGSSIKLAGFVLAIKIFGEMFVSYIGYLGKILDVLAVLTMFVGNVAALLQTNLKRMFAYSSISHAGYLLLAVSLLGQNSSSSAIYYYLIIYGLMFLGLFAMLTFIEEKTKSTQIQELSGLGFTYPMFSICLSIFAISAAGIPPTAGFLAKYLIFLNAVSMGKTFVVILAVISSLIGVFYYLKVLVYLYMKEPTRAVAVVVPNRLAFAGVVFCAFCLIYFMLFPARLGVYF